MLRKELLLRSLLVIAAICVATPAVRAEIVTQPVPVGETYRLVFVTDAVTTADSRDIEVYNNFVSDAAAAIPELAALTDPWGNAVTWTAIVSSRGGNGFSQVDARDNTGTNTNGTPEDVQIFNLQGLKVAGNNADLWDGTIQTAINRTEKDGFLLLMFGPVQTSMAPNILMWVKLARVRTK